MAPIEKTEKRLEWVDNARGIAILLVIIGHVLPDGLFHTVIYAFHMPLFFVISGLFLLSNDKSSVQSFVTKKFWRLYVPYLLYGLLILTPWDFIWFNYIIPNPEMKYEAIYRALGTIPAFRNDWPIYGYLWFLPCLFVGSCILKCVYTYCYSARYYVIFILYISGILYNTIIHVSLPLSLDAALISLPFLLFGNELMRRRISLDNWIIPVISIIVFVLSVWANGLSPALYTGTYGNDILFLASGITGSVVVIYACHKLHSIKILKLGGVNTLNIYALHNMFLPFLKYGLKFVEPYGSIAIGCYSVLISIVTFILLLPVCKFINKHIPVLAGFGLKY